MKRLIGVLALMLCLLPLGAQAQAKAKWTIIYWSAADTDLEPFMIGDLMEMQIVGSTDQVNIVVQMDRSPGYDETNGTWTDTRRFLLSKGQNGAVSSGDFQIERESFIANIASAKPEDFGLTQKEFDQQLNALRDASQAEFESIILGQAAPVVGADPQTMQQKSIESVGESDSSAASFSDFIIWSVQNYPADHYAVILSDHGGGWQGVGFDETSGGDPLTMTELGEALKTATETTGVSKFDLVAFDACLMADLEVYKVLAPYADYTIAAQEPIPGAGWEYVTPLKALTAKPDMTMVELGTSIVDSFLSYYTNTVTNYDEFDLHLIDLSKVGALDEAVTKFTDLVAQNPQTYVQAIGYARDQSYVADKGDPGFSNLDLKDFMVKMQKYSDDAAIREAAQGVIDAVAAVQVHGGGSPKVNDNGVAIYFPANAEVYANAKPIYTQQLGGVVPNWISFLDTFHGVAATTYNPATTNLSLKITDVNPSDYSASVYDPPVITFDTDGTGIVDMQFYAALENEDGSFLIVDASALESASVDENGEALPPYPEGPTSTEFQWNVETPLATDGAGNAEILTFISDPNNASQVTVRGLYQPRSGEETEAKATFDLETRSLTAMFGIQTSDVGQAVGEIKMQPGDTFEPYYLVLSSDGNLTYYKSGTKLLITEKPITFQYVPAPTGNYQLSLWIQDIAGNTAQDTANFTIDNTDLDTSWRGFKDLDGGISFLFPWNWADPTQRLFNDETYRMELSNEEGTQLINIDSYDEANFEVTSLDDLIQVVQPTFDDLNAAQGDTTSVEAGLNGEYNAAVIPYTYTDEAGDHVGRSIFVYVEESELGYVIDIDVPAADADFADTLVNQILKSLVFTPLPTE